MQNHLKTLYIEWDKKEMRWEIRRLPFAQDNYGPVLWASEEKGILVCTSEGDESELINAIRIKLIAALEIIECKLGTRNYQVIRHMIYCLNEVACGEPQPEWRGFN
jgi:hypothetical protein